MKFLEKDLEEIIYKADADVIYDRGLYSYGIKKRQLKIGGYGVSDLIVFEKPYYHTGFKRHMKGTITVLELKQDKIGVSTFFQALRYAKGIKHYIDKCRPTLTDAFNYRIVLIGKNVDFHSSFVFLTDFFNVDLSDTDLDDYSKTNVELYQYEYRIDGLHFVELGSFIDTNHGFDKTKSNL